MKAIIKNVSTSLIVLSVLAIVLGIVLIAYPGISLAMLGYAVSAYLIIQGIALIVLDVKAWFMYLPFSGLLKGVLNIVLGALLARNPGKIAVLIGIVMGVWIIVSSFEGIRFSAALRNTGAPWVLMIIVNIIDILLGFVVLFTPVLSTLSLTMCAGMLLIVHSVISIINMIVMKKNAIELEKKFARIEDTENNAQD